MAIFGTEEGLGRFDGIDFTVLDRDNAPQLRSSFIQALLADPDGNLWIGTYDGLTRLRDGGFSPGCGACIRTARAPCGLAPAAA